MKKCGYCAKEISYHEMYCCDECQNSANKFYETRDKVTTLMSVINGISVMSIGIGLFIFSFFREIGAFMVAIPLVILGILYILFPIPADVMIEKNKIEKAQKTTRYIGIALLILGIIATIFAIITI
ncbi:MAG: hypothetical protein IKB73_05025 [Ruminococcus sp.]|nr:hypothetical protein [Ruminococcus sp.]